MKQIKSVKFAHISPNELIYEFLNLVASRPKILIDWQYLVRKYSYEGDENSRAVWFNLKSFKRIILVKFAHISPIKLIYEFSTS